MDGSATDTDTKRGANGQPAPEGDAGAADQFLIAAIATGDAAALETLYDQYSSIAFALLLRIVADRAVAEELLQEVFLRIWRHAESYQAHRGPVRGWLLGIAHHAALNELRRQRRRPRTVPPAEREDATAALATHPDPGAVDPAEAAWVAERRARLIGALGWLPPPQRTVIELYAAGYSQAEIATRLDEPLGTVKTRIRRGLRRLRDLVADLGPEGEA